MTATPPLLIRGATLRDGERRDVLLVNGRIEALGIALPAGDAHVIDAQGGCLLPGLHDHHLHLAATAAAYASVACGPPTVRDETDLALALATPGEGWLRGIAYHESVAGFLDRDQLDRIAPSRPVRIQHRSGRMWFFNSAGIDRLAASGVALPANLDCTSGRLFDGDAWLRTAIGGHPPSLTDLSHALVRLGVTGVTDMGPSNGPPEHQWLRGEQAEGGLSQRLLLAGTGALATLDYDAWTMLGPVKIHLHEAALPPYEDFVRDIHAAHGMGRGVAVHCVTEVELVYTLAAFAEAGTDSADRIEHAAVTPDTLIAQIAMLGLPIAVQPLFVRERGDAYRRDIPTAEWPGLYRLRAFLAAGVALAGSSDAPYCGFDPWAAMAAAVDRKTESGATLNADEALSPEQALDLYLADPLDLRRQRSIAPGQPADLCLLREPWRIARSRLSASLVRLTVIDGRMVHDGVDQPPIESGPGADRPA